MYTFPQPLYTANRTRPHNVTSRKIESSRYRVIEMDETPKKETYLYTIVDEKTRVKNHPMTNAPPIFCPSFKNDSGRFNGASTIVRAREICTHNGKSSHVEWGKIRRVRNFQFVYYGFFLFRMGFCRFFGAGVVFSTKTREG